MQSTAVTLICTRIPGADDVETEKALALPEYIKECSLGTENNHGMSTEQLLSKTC